MDTLDSIPNYVQLKGIQVLIDGLKQIFFISEKEQQLQLLTIVPHDWGRKKIEYFFACTEHQSKQAVLLRNTYDVLAKPLFFSGNKEIGQPIIEKVLKFYENDDISRQSSNKKDSIHIHGEEKIFRFMEMSIAEAYQLFKENHPGILIGHSKFYSLRPKWVKLKSSIRNCLCIYHENFYLLLEVN